MHEYDDPDARRVADALAAVVAEEIAQRRLLGRAAQDAFTAEYERRAKLLRQAEIPVAARRSDDFNDPMQRPLDGEPAPWQLRRAADNQVAEQAIRNLDARHPDGYSAQQYVREVERLGNEVGRSYRDD